MPTIVTRCMLHAIAPLYDGWDDTLIWSCLQGHMGQAWADDVHAPSAAQVITADFCFFAGDASGPGARGLVAHIPSGYPKNEMLMASKEDAWHGLIEDIYKGRCNKFLRYAFKKEPGVFDRAKLLGFVAALPPG